MAAWLRWILVPLRRQFLLACLRSIDLIGRPAAEDRVGSIGVVVADPTPDPGSCLTAGLEGIVEVAFVFERSPQPLDEDVVHPAAATVHRDADFGLPQGVGEGKAGELRALIGVEISGLPKQAIASSSAVTQKSASIVFDSLQLRTFRLNQSMIATRYRKPLRIGM